jgi:glycosyltransferase involved in cell wall biosynthesis
MSTKPAVISVVITTKNRISLLPRAIESVLEQTWSALELIVVDDGSDTPVVLPTTDSRVRLIRNEVSTGISEARNVGFRAAVGQYFCMLDDDDWFLPEKLERQFEFMQRHPDIDLVFSRVIKRDAEGNNSYYIPLNHVHTPEINLLSFNVIHPSSVLFRREVFETIPFDPRIKKYEDTYFFNRVCFTFQTDYLPMDAAVWMQDGRPDQLTKHFYHRNYQNFKLVCEDLHDILRRYPSARWRYYARLAWQAFRSGHIIGAIKAVFRIIF